MEKWFHLKENGTTVRTEIVAGLTTFMTMAYIIALNPNLLTGFGAEGMDLWNGVFMATCIASAIGMFCMAFLANKPFAMAPGMGLNTFFAIVVANIAAMTGMTYLQSFQSALVIIFVEGLVFIVLSALNVREKIVEAIPLGVRLGIGPAIGLMLMNIGFGSNAGIYSETGGPFFAMRDFFGALTASYAKTTMGSGYAPMVLTVVTMLVGLFTIVALDHKKVKGAVLYGMLVASVVFWASEFFFLGTNPFESLDMST
jgi:AGZA family xanthine/uracil permease-like MFS transporter